MEGLRNFKSLDRIIEEFHFGSEDDDRVYRLKWIILHTPKITLITMVGTLQSDNNCVLLRLDDFVETDYSSFRARI